MGDRKGGGDGIFDSGKHLFMGWGGIPKTHDAGHSVASTCDIQPSPRIILLRTITVDFSSRLQLTGFYLFSHFFFSGCLAYWEKEESVDR